MQLCLYATNRLRNKLTYILQMVTVAFVQGSVLFVRKTIWKKCLKNQDKRENLKFRFRRHFLMELDVKT